jgi:hypothetical protein
MFWFGAAIGFLSGTACGFLLSVLARAVIRDAHDPSRKKWVAEPIYPRLRWREAALLIVLLAIIVYVLIVLFFE